MLGHKDEDREKIPRVVESLLGRDIVMAVCGVSHTIALSGELLEATVCAVSGDDHREGGEEGGRRRGEGGREGERGRGEGGRGRSGGERERGKRRGEGFGGEREEVAKIGRWVREEGRGGIICQALLCAACRLS